MRRLEVRYDRIVDQLVTKVRLYSLSEDRTVECEAVWDTGAAYSGISHAMAVELQLLEIGKARQKTANGERVCSVYAIKATVWPSDGRPYISTPREFDVAKDSSIQFLIGMDIIKRGRFTTEIVEDKSVLIFEAPAEALDFVRVVSEYHDSYKGYGSEDNRRGYLSSELVEDKDGLEMIHRYVRYEQGA